MRVPCRVPMMRTKTKTVDQTLLEALQDYHVVRLEDFEFNAKLVWCLEHCQNKFRDIRDQGTRAWYFENEQDAIMFAMKWSS